jgi:hypothetical protein
MAMPQFNLGQRWANISKTVGDIAQMQKSTAERKRAEKMKGEQMLQQTFKDLYGFADDWGKEQTRQRERKEDVQMQKDLLESSRLHEKALAELESGYRTSEDKAAYDLRQDDREAEQEIAEGELKLKQDEAALQKKEIEAAIAYRANMTEFEKKRYNDQVAANIENRAIELQRLGLENTRIANLQELALEKEKTKQLQIDADAAADIAAAEQDLEQAKMLRELSDAYKLDVQKLNDEFLLAKQELTADLTRAANAAEIETATNKIKALAQMAFPDLPPKEAVVQYLARQAPGAKEDVDPLAYAFSFIESVSPGAIQNLADLDEEEKQTLLGHANTALNNLAGMTNAPSSEVINAAKLGFHAMIMGYNKDDSDVDPAAAEEVADAMIYLTSGWNPYTGFEEEEEQGEFFRDAATVLSNYWRFLTAPTREPGSGFTGVGLGVGGGMAEATAQVASTAGQFTKTMQGQEKTVLPEEDDPNWLQFKTLYEEVLPRWKEKSEELSEMRSTNVMVTTGVTEGDETITLREIMQEAANLYENPTEVPAPFWATLVEGLRNIQQKTYVGTPRGEREHLYFD